MKYISFYVVFLISGLIFAVVIGESVLRFSRGILPESVQLRIHWQEMGRQGLRSVAHPYIGFLYPPNSEGSFERGDLKFSFHTDRYGFRNKEPWPDRADIVVIGDSLAFGYGVGDEQSWTAIVQRKLPSISVINLALIGSGPPQYQRIFETFGRQLRPQLLIVVLFPDNDFWDAKRFDEWLKAGAQGNYDAFRFLGDDESDDLASLKRFLKKTYIYALLVETYRAFKERRFFEGKVVNFGDGSRVQLVESQLKRQIILMQKGVPGFDLTLEAVRGIKQTASEAGVNLLVLLFPSKEAVYLKDKAKKDIHKPLKVELQREGIDFLDLAPPLQEHARRGEKTFYEIDGHPNQKGYEIVADAVVSYIKERQSARYKGLAVDNSMQANERLLENGR
ncbi:MAG: hypothetical protein JSW39_08425 [Desulfobacterales bacterium]|nr:MAG: hypothetical protein JSW39_08425 [Desulfobacterales bacterium]